MHLDYDNYNNFFDKNDSGFDPYLDGQSEYNNNKSENMNNFDINYISNKNENDTDNNNEQEFNNNYKHINLESKENYNILYNSKDVRYLENDEHLKNDKTFYVNKNNEKMKENEMPNTIMSINGKEIKRFNKTIIETIKDLFGDDENEETYEIDELIYDKKDMQLLRNKKRRRTKNEILYEKSLKYEEKIIYKKKGRNKKNEDNILDLAESHSKKADDNIIKKINSNFLESVKDWLNSSFINENGLFTTPKKKFLKIKPIFENLKKDKITELMKTPFKNIFSKEISERFTKFGKDYNKLLINEIYVKNKQYFVIFILDLTFIDVLNIFNGETTINDFRELLKKKNIEEENKIIQFYNNFNKLALLLRKIYSTEIKKNKKEIVKDYIQRICILCINYEAWFKRKFIRSPNKKIK